jgi:TldD protein
VAGLKVNIAIAYSDKIDLTELLSAVSNVQAIARQGQAAKVALPSHGTYPQLYAPINPLNSFYFFLVA